MQVLIVDIQGFPSDMQRRAVRQLPTFSRFSSMVHGVMASDLDATISDCAHVMLLRVEGDDLWTGLKRVDAQLADVLHQYPRTTTVITSTRVRGDDTCTSSSFVGVCASPGVHVPTLPQHTTVNGISKWIVRRVGHGQNPTDPLPPPVSRRLDTERLLVQDTEDPLAARLLWVRALVRRPGRCSDVLVTLRFALRDLVDDKARWDADTDAERSRTLARHTEWPTPTVSVEVHDDLEEVDNDDTELLSAALALVGPTVHVEVPRRMWLSPPLPRERSVLLHDDREARTWLPWTLRRRLPFPLSTELCTVWVCEEEDDERRAHHEEQLGAKGAELHACKRQPEAV